MSPLTEYPLSLLLAGPPNVGKSTVFNQLTGLRQHVGNWPGKTIEKRDGDFDVEGTPVAVTDLPGSYSLTCVSPEEEIARDALAFGDADVIVVVINAAQLEKGFAFLAEVFLLGRPTVLAINMIDLCHQAGKNLPLVQLQAALGIPVVGLEARQGVGISALKNAVVQLAQQTGHRTAQALAPPPLSVGELLPFVEVTLDEPLRRFVATKVLEGDKSLLTRVQKNLSVDQREQLRLRLMQHEVDGVKILAARHQWVDEMLTRLGLHATPFTHGLTDRIDKITAHPWLGLGVFSLVIFLLFTAVFAVGTPLQEWLDGTFITPLAKTISERYPNRFLSALAADGLVSGVGLVLSFVPVLFLFFFGMAFLEDVGYMPRAAFVMDRFMHRIGLHGRSFVPLFMGMGCNVPALMGTRAIDDPAARTLTMLLIPMVPCSARLAVIAFFGAAFFAHHQALFTWSMIFLPFAALTLVGALLARTVFKGKQVPLVMELPLYHRPHVRGILIQAWHRTFAFIRQAGGLILIFSIGIFLLAWHPSGNTEFSLLGRMGVFLNPLGALFGGDWRIMVALITSFVVKENTISTLSILTHVSTEPDTMTAVRAILTPEAAVAFMVIQMLFVPCMSTLVTFRREAGSWKWPLMGLVLQGVISLVCGIALYQIVK